jgi:hypothetical protein
MAMHGDRTSLASFELRFGKNPPRTEIADERLPHEIGEVGP